MTASESAAAPTPALAPEGGGQDADTLVDGVSLDKALKYYQSRSEVEQVQIQISSLIVTWALGFFSFGFAGLLILVRAFTFYLHVQAMAETSERKAMVDALGQLQPSGPGARAPKPSEGSGPGAQAPEAVGEDSDGPVLKRNAPRVQRSARPMPAQKTADLGINFCPCPDGLKITALKPGTDAADSDLKVGDIVTIIGEQFTAGCTPADVVAALVGPEKSEVEVTAKRTGDGKTNRVSAKIVRDAAPRSADEWIAQWKSGGSNAGGPSFIAQLLEPLSKLSNVVSTGGLLIAVRGALSIGAKTVAGTLSPAAKMANEQKRMNDTRAAAKSAREAAEKSESALQDEIDQALADGVITEEEQREINAKRAILDKAKNAQEQATKAARQAEEEAKAALAKAEAETQKLIQKAQAEADEILKKADKAAQEQAAAATKLLKKAEDEAKRKKEEANSKVKKSQVESNAKMLALQKEMEQAMADGVIDEAEQKAIDLKQAALDVAKQLQNDAEAAAAAAAAEATTLLAKAEADAMEMKKKSEAAAAELLKKSEELAKRQAEEATAIAKMQAEAQAAETIRQAEEEVEKKRKELLKEAEAFQQKVDEANAAAKKAADDEQAKKASLQKEIDDAMADGHIDAAEQAAIDAKKKAFDQAEHATQVARQKVADAAAEARSVRTKAVEDAEKLMKESEKKAAEMIKKAEEEVQKKAASATAAANKKAEELQQKLAAAKAQAEKDIAEIDKRKDQAQEEAIRLTAKAQEQAKAVMREAFEMRRKAEEEAKKAQEMAAKVLKDAMADGVIDAEEQKAIDAANAAQKKAQQASENAAKREEVVSKKAEEGVKGLEKKIEAQQKATYEFTKKAAILNNEGNGIKKTATHSQRSVLIDDSSMNLRINLTVLSSKHLPSMDYFGKCDGLVEIDFDGQKQKTNHIKQNYDPEWNEQFDFTFHRATFDAKGVGDLVLGVKDYDAVSGGDDIGEAIVSGQEIMKFIKSGGEGKTAEFFDLPVNDKKGVQVKGNDGQPCVINIKMKLFLPEKKQDERLQAPVQLTMTLEIPFHETGEEGSSKREAFKRDMEKDLAKASGLPAENFKITKLSAGSVIVDMTILPDPLGAIAPSAVARNLEQQAADPNSPLRSGKLTSKTQGIQVLSPQQPSTPPTPRYREPERARPSPTGNAAKDAAMAYEFMKQEKERERDGDGRANIPVLGVKIDVVSESVFITAVDPQGPLSGLVRQGDSIVKINGLPMLSAKQIKQEILFGPPGSNINLTVFQGLQREVARQRDRQIICFLGIAYVAPEGGMGTFQESTHVLFREQGPDGRLVIKYRGQYGMAPDAFSPYNSYTQPNTYSKPRRTCQSVGYNEIRQECAKLSKEALPLSQ